MNRLLLSALWTFTLAASYGAGTKFVPYQDFIKSVDTGKVTVVHFVDLATIEWRETGVVDEVYVTGTPVRPHDDPLLLRFLEGKKVTIAESGASIAPKLPLSFGYSTFDLLWFIIGVQVAMFAFLIFKLRGKRTHNEAGPGKLLEALPGAAPSGGAGPRPGADRPADAARRISITARRPVFGTVFRFCLISAFGAVLFPLLIILPFAKIDPALTPPKLVYGIALLLTAWPAAVALWFSIGGWLVFLIVGKKWPFRFSFLCDGSPSVASSHSASDRPTPVRS